MNRALIRRAVAALAVLTASLAPAAPGWATRTAVEAGQVTFDIGPDTPRMFSYSVTGNVIVHGPLADGTSPGAIKVTVDGVEHDAVLWQPWKQINWQDPSAWQGDSFWTDTWLAVGTHQVEIRLLDTAGQVIGTPLTRTVVVQTPTFSVAAPKLVVGRPSSASVSIDAPPGQHLRDCHLVLSGSETGAPFGDDLCLNHPASVRTTATGYPPAAGGQRFYLRLGIVDNSDGNLDAPASVYANRRATVSTPPVPYGTKGTARAVVQDSTTDGVWKAAAAGSTVTLQRVPLAGGSPWLTIGAAKTGAGGVAQIPFNLPVSSVMRVVLPSTVPGEWTVSSEWGAECAAVVAWRSAPPTAAKGKTVSFDVTATPYEVGNVAHLEVRKPGMTAWTIVRSVAVPTNRIAHFTWAFPSTGAWGVRVYRTQTLNFGGGLSPVITTTVK